MFTLALAQMNPTWENRDKNYGTAATMAQEARDRGADLLILPEMFPTGFSMNPSVVTERAPFPTREMLSTLAEQHHVNMIGGYSRFNPAGQGENAADVIGRGGELLGTYVKSHVFSFSKENEVHINGNGAFAIGMDGVKTGIFICYDLRFPELFRKVARDMELAVIIASWPASRQKHWDLLLRARAIENQCFVVGVNRVGEGDGLLYTGGSAVIDPLGETVLDAGSTEGLHVVSIDLSRVEAVRQQFPFLRDMHLI